MNKELLEKIATILDEQYKDFKLAEGEERKREMDYYVGMTFMVEQMGFKFSRSVARNEDGSFKAVAHVVWEL